MPERQCGLPTTDRRRDGPNARREARHADRCYALDARIVPRPGVVPVAPVAAPESISPAQLAEWLAAGDTQVLDFTTLANYRNSHIPGAAWLLRSTLQQQGKALLPDAGRYVLTCGSSLLAQASC